MDVVIAKRKIPLFEMGRLVVTRGVLELMKKNEGFSDFVRESLNRHAWGNWGDLSEGDRVENELSLDQDGRLLSAYSGRDGLPRIWIITEGDRSATTILFPEEY